MRVLQPIFFIRNSVCFLGATLILSGCLMNEKVEEPAAVLESDNELSGSVGDGPIVGASMRVLRNDGEVLAEFESDFVVSYNVTVRTKGKYYPLTIEARDGTDMVTFLAPDFEMFSAVLKPAKKSVANVNPFTTIAVEMSKDMVGGQTSSNIEAALNIAVVQLNSGLDTLISTNSMSTRIDASNIAEIIKASETLGETIRRTRDALLAVGRTATGDIVVRSLSSDLTDSVVDGVGGPRADARIAAVTTIAAAQTALESMRNRLHVNGSDATILMSAAVDHILAAAPQTTFAELVVTEHIIRQVRIGVIAAELISPSPELTGLKQSVSNIQPGMLPSVVDAILPQNASQLLDNVMLMVAAGDGGLLDAVNDTARNGGDVPAVNRAPTLAGSPPTKVLVGASYDFVPVTNDPDGDALTCAVSGKPDWANFDVSTGRLFGTPGTGDVGLSTNIVISVSDGQYNAALAPFSITVEAVANNSPPTISGSAPPAVTVGNPYEFTPVAGDADGDTVTFNINNKPVWASFATSNGRLGSTPGAGDEGTYSNIVITVTDGTDSASLAPFSITVNAVPINLPPSISGSPASTATEGNAYVFVPTASDPEGAVLTFTITGKPDWTSFDSTSGRLSGTPAAADVGIYGGMVITVSDAEDSASLGPFAITVESIGTGSATLSWTAPTENEDGSPLTDLAGYKIYWGTTPGIYPNLVTINNPGITIYVIENLGSGTYEFVSTAFNAAGVESAYSNTATKTIP